MSQEWNIKSRGHVCSICGKGLVDKSPVVSVLRELPEGYERLDCHPECWKTAPRDWEPFSMWEGVYAEPPPPEKKETLKKETADELLRHLIGRKGKFKYRSFTDLKIFINIRCKNNILFRCLVF